MNPLLFYYFLTTILPAIIAIILLSIGIFGNTRPIGGGIIGTVAILITLSITSEIYMNHKVDFIISYCIPFAIFILYIAVTSYYKAPTIHITIPIELRVVFSAIFIFAMISVMVIFLK